MSLWLDNAELRALTGYSSFSDANLAHGNGNPPDAHAPGSRGNRPVSPLNPQASDASRVEARSPYWRRKVDGRCVDNHRLVAEQMLGRKLKRGEVVHHKNGDTTDDRPENLEVMTRREHSRLHRLGHVPDGPAPVTTPRVPHERAAEIPRHVWAEYRPHLESPRAVAAELGITTAEVLARARGETTPIDFSLHLVREGSVLWIYRPHKRTASLRSGAHSAR